MGRAPIRLAALAQALGRSVEGDAEVAVSGVASLESAGPEDLVFARSPRYAAALAGSAAAAVIAPSGLVTGGRPTIRSPQPGLDFARAARHLVPSAVPPAGIHATAAVSASAWVDPSASVGPGCWLGEGARVGAGSVLVAQVSVGAGVVVGADCVLHPAAVLYEGARLGDRVVVHSGAVIGAEGFGFERDEQGGYEQVPHLGGVVLEDDVVVGANSSIERGTLDDTRVGRGTKIDDLVVIAHNCQIGAHSLIAAQSGLAGGVRIGERAILMARVGVADHRQLGPRSFAGPRASVIDDVPADARVIGTPALEIGRMRRIAAATRRLPELFQRVRVLERRGGPSDAGPGESGGA